MRRNRTSQFQLVKRRNGVTASVAIKKYSAQSPVLRVMNSIGLAPRRSRNANTTSRTNGNRQSTNKTLRNCRTRWVERSFRNAMDIFLRFNSARLIQ